MEDNINNADFWANIIIKELKDEGNASIYGGSIPRATGRTQDNSIKILNSNRESAIILIGGGDPPKDGRIFFPDKNNPPLSWYAGELEDSPVTNFGNQNKHKGFIESFIGNEFMAALSNYGIEVVKIDIR